MITPDRCLVFPSMEFVRSQVQKLGKGNYPIVINCSQIFLIDFTGAKIMESLMGYFQLSSRIIYFYNPNNKVSKVLKGIRKDMPIFYNIKDLELVLSETKTCI